MTLRIAFPAACVALISILALSACAQSPARVETRQSPSQSAAAKSGAAVQAPAPAGSSARASVQDAAPESAASASNEYRLGAGDVVKIAVYGNPDLATETEVSQGGKISFPLV